MVKTVLKSIIITSIFCLIGISTFADAPNPPDPGGSPGTGDLPVGGGSPIGGGLIILASLGIAYGAKKIYTLRQEEL